MANGSFNVHMPTSFLYIGMLLFWIISKAYMWQNLINTFNVVIQIFIFNKIFGIKQIGKTLVQ